MDGQDHDSTPGPDVLGLNAFYENGDIDAFIVSYCKLAYPDKFYDGEEAYQLLVNRSEVPSIHGFSIEPMQNDDTRSAGDYDDDYTKNLNRIYRISPPAGLFGDKERYIRLVATEDSWDGFVLVRLEEVEPRLVTVTAWFPIGG